MRPTHWKIEDLEIPAADQLEIERHLSGESVVFPKKRFPEEGCLVAVGSINITGESSRWNRLLFRVCGVSNSLNFELSKEREKTLLDQEPVWIPFPRWGAGEEKLDGILSINDQKLNNVKITILSYIVHDLLFRIDKDRTYPFSLDARSEDDEPRSPWRMVCIGPGEIVWEDAVENHMKETIYIARQEPKKVEVSNLIEYTLRCFRALAT